MIKIIKGDITKLDVDAIVNAANWGLLGGAGVDGAIHKAAGEGLMKECQEIIRTKHPSGLKTGEAVITKGYNLKARYVIHTVGPVYGKGKLPSSLLASAYINCLNLAEEHGLKSIAFPPISTGLFSYPKKEAIKVVRKVMSEYKFKFVEKVVLCFYGEEEYRVGLEGFYR